MRGFLVIFSLAAIALILGGSVVSASGSGDCYYEGLKLTIKRGETVYPEGECLRMSCSAEGQLRPEPCMMAIPPNCHYVEGDKSKKWPGCCPSYKCN